MRSRAAILRANVVTRPVKANRKLWRHRIQSLHYELPDHSDKCRMCTGGRRANQVHPKLVSKVAGFRVEIVEHFHVIGDKPEWRDDDVFHPVLL